MNACLYKCGLQVPIIRAEKETLTTQAPEKTTKKPESQTLRTGSSVQHATGNSGTVLNFVKPPRDCRGVIFS